MIELGTINKESISELVDRFYTHVRADAVIGPIFNEEVDNWDAHLALLKEFWESVLLGAGTYKGNPLVAHFKLPMQPQFFRRWLELFGETAREIFSPEDAAHIVARADHIAVNMRRVLAAKDDGAGLESKS